jgi:hypothetical protein
VLLIGVPYRLRVDSYPGGSQFESEPLNHLCCVRGLYQAVQANGGGFALNSYFQINSERF